MTNSNSDPRLYAAVNAIKILAIAELLAKLSKKGDAAAVGKKTLVLAYLIDPASIGTQRQLAQRMGVSRARATQMITSLRRNLFRFYR